MIFDTHAHYDDRQFEEDREELLGSMRENGVELIVDAASDIASWDKIEQLTDRYPFIYGAIGVHPDEVGELDEEKMKRMEQLLAREKMVAVGEIGLDYYWDKENRDLQKMWFIRQLELAKQLDLPVIIHSREAAADTMEIMKQYAGELSGVIHCFSYSPEQAKEYVKMGFYLGIGGVVTFKNAKKLKEVVQEIIEQAEEEVGYKPPKYAFDLQIMMLPDEGLVLVLSEKEPLENKSGAQLLQALQEMKRVFEEKKAEIGAAEKKAQAGENAGESGKKNKKAAEAQKPQFAIFAFRNIGRVIEYAAVLPTNLRIDSTLYRMEDGTCYAYVRKGGASYERYSRACIQAMEFAALYAADEQKLRYLEEHGECLIREKALKKLRV